MADEDLAGQPWYEIHEVYYHKAGEPNSYGERISPVCGESLEEIKQGLKAMKKALKKPVLWKGDEFPQEYSEGWVTTKGILSTLTNEEKV